MEFKIWSQEKRKLVKKLFTSGTFGWVYEVTGIIIKGVIPESRIGDLCIIKSETDILAEIVGFSDNYTLLTSLEPLVGVVQGWVIHLLNTPHRIKTNETSIGSVFDGYGRAVNTNKPSVLVLNNLEKDCTEVLTARYGLLDRIHITEPLYSGIKAIDGLLTLGRGQRIGLFAGPGCGKTSLLLEIIKLTPCDIIVVGLIGERGRELNEFFDVTKKMKEKKIIIVCATSDKGFMERSRAAFTATAIAEAYCNNGASVLLLIDSLTRFVRAQREIGIAIGEPIGKTGLPSSVYTYLPRLLERAGNFSSGSITAIYTVLFEDRDKSDPVAEEIKSILDGHIVLTSKLAERGHFPAIDVLSSLSRLMSKVVDTEHEEMARKIKMLMSSYRESEFLLKIGEYKESNDLLLDEAVSKMHDINIFTQQSSGEFHSIEMVNLQMKKICES